MRGIARQGVPSSFFAVANIAGPSKPKALKSVQYICTFFSNYYPHIDALMHEEKMKCLHVNFPIERLKNVIKNAKNKLSDHVDVTFSYLSR